MSPTIGWSCRRPQPGTVVSLTDPDTGATLLVGTQRRNGQGVPALRRAPEFSLLPTWQGVVVEPNVDTVALRPTPQGFVLAGALTLSPPSDVANELARSAGLTRQFDFPSQPRGAAAERLRRQVAEDAATAPLGSRSAPAGGGANHDRARSRRRGGRHAAHGRGR